MFTFRCNKETVMARPGFRPGRSTIYWLHQHQTRGQDWSAGLLVVVLVVLCNEEWSCY